MVDPVNGGGGWGSRGSMTNIPDMDAPLHTLTNGRVLVSMCGRRRHLPKGRSVSVSLVYVPLCRGVCTCFSACVGSLCEGPPGVSAPPSRH